MKIHFAITGLIASALFVAAAHANEPPPSCDDPQTKALVVDTVNRAIRNSQALATLANGARAIEVESTYELYSDAAIRACEARIERSDGMFRNGYTVEWVSRSSGTFAIQLVGLDTLRARYSDMRPDPTPSPKQLFLANASDYETCLASANSMEELLECSQAEAAAQDARLNAAYKKAMAVIGDKPALLASQRQWLKDRDTACAPSRSGLEGELDLADCMAVITAERADELESMG